MYDYEQACIDAATRQGLDPITAALDEAGVLYAVEQTGGFCMVVTINQPDGTFVMTAEDDGQVLRGWFTGSTWHDGPAEDSDDRVLTMEEFGAWATDLARGYRGDLR